MKKIWILFFAFFYLENYAQELGHSLSGVQFSNTDPGFLVLKENEIMVFNSSNYYNNYWGNYLIGYPLPLEIVNKLDLLIEQNP